MGCVRETWGVSAIEVLNRRPAVKKAILLLLYHTYIKVSKDALAQSGPYQTLMSVWYDDPGGEMLFTCLLPYKFKKYPYAQVLCSGSHSEH